GIRDFHVTGVQTCALPIFHQATVTPQLERHWDALGLPAGGTVFVPLCGKSLDMAWLAGRGHRVLGVELSEVAVRDFFAGQGLVRSEERRVGTDGRCGWAGE